MSTVRDRIEAGEFENILPYPTIEVLGNDPAYQQLSKEQGQLLDKAAKIKSAKRALIVKMREEYDMESTAKRSTFKAVLEKEYGLQNHPNRDKIWMKAWDDGHSGGWTDVLNVYDELADLVL